MSYSTLVCNLNFLKTIPQETSLLSDRQSLLAREENSQALGYGETHFHWSIVNREVDGKKTTFLVL